MMMPHRSQRILEIVFVWIWILKISKYGRPVLKECSLVLTFGVDTWPWGVSILSCRCGIYKNFTVYERSFDVAVLSDACRLVVMASTLHQDRKKNKSIFRT